MRPEDVKQMTNSEDTDQQSDQGLHCFCKDLSVPKTQNFSYFILRLFGIESINQALLPFLFTGCVHSSFNGCNNL